MTLYSLPELWSVLEHLESCPGQFSMLRRDVICRIINLLIKDKVVANG